MIGKQKRLETRNAEREKQMLKITHLTNLVGSKLRFGINFDGTIIIQGMGEFHVHPDDLQEGDFNAVATRNSIALNAEQVAQIKAVLETWKAEGNKVMGKDVMRVL